jgi:hypothetical protein
VGVDVDVDVDVGVGPMRGGGLILGGIDDDERGGIDDDAREVVFIE